MSDLIDTTEMYLRTIFELEEEGVPPIRARIAERLSQSGPTVSQTVARMERDGLVRVTPQRSLELTAQGRRDAVHVMRKHRLAEVLLVNVIGVPLDAVHDEACRWEHVISDEVEQRLVTVLGNPSHSPFGNPIPPLELADYSVGNSALGDSLPLSQHVTEQPKLLRIDWVAEFAQNRPDFLQCIIDLGMTTGAVVQAHVQGDVITVAAHGITADIRPELADLIMVSVVSNAH